MEDPVVEDVLAVVALAILLLLLLGGPFVLALLVERLARKGHPRPSSDESGGKPRQSIRAWASVAVPLLTIPAWMGAVALLNWLADLGLLAPYPPPVWSLALGGWSVALLGLILGVVALVQITRRPDLVVGRDRAWAGIALSWWAAGAIALMMPVANRASESPRNEICLANVKNLTTALDRYRATHDDTFPDGSRWSDLLRPYVKGRWGFVCPNARKLKCGYAYNANLSGRKYSVVRAPETVLAFFESNAGWNAAGGPELLVPEPRHGVRYGFDAYGFADGHARRFERAKTTPGKGDLRWEIPLAAP